MRKTAPWLCCGLLVGISGCTIHPIPYDVPGYRTLDIVKQIRCEAKRAVDKYYPKKPGALSVAQQRALYEKMNIGYKFTFTITENNKVGAGAGFRLPLSNGTFTLGIAGGSDRQRLGERDFTIINSFKSAMDEKACTIEAKGENSTYPITGVIGLEEVIRTFLELQALGIGKLPPVDFGAAPPPAAAKPKKKETADGKTEEFVETFEFTTTIRGSLNPEVELRPVGSGFALGDAVGTLSADRTDKHSVVITLAPNYDAAKLTLNNQYLRKIEDAVKRSTRQ
jgi:hypothetical protein